MKNIPQKNGEETCMEMKLSQSKLNKKFLGLMKIEGLSYILQNVKWFVEIFFSVWGRNYVDK